MARFEGDNKGKKLSSLFVMGVTILLIGIFFLPYGLLADDWPTYQHDNQRSCISSESLKMPLFEQWQYSARYAPQPAWPAPARTDYWHRETNLKPRVIYDRANHVASVGDAIYFGSSANDKVYCLDATSGEERWSFFTAGPVRLSPTIHRDKVFVGSDDGKVYCLNSNTGELIWDYKASPTDRLLPGNERIISVHPVRTGVLVDDGVAYFCSGMFPNEGVYMVALNAEDGAEVWRSMPDNVSPQGYLLASKTNLYIPTGRTAPVVFDRSNGEKIGAFQGNGGTYAILHDNALIYGGGDLGEIEQREPNSRDQVASFNGMQIIVADEVSYLRSDGEIAAIDRRKNQESYRSWKKLSNKRNDLANRLWDLRETRELAKPEEYAKIDQNIDKMIDRIAATEKQLKDLESGGEIWRVETDTTYDMILTKDVLFVGSNNQVTAYDLKTGKLLWSSVVNGKAYGLAVANGRLLVSTDRGAIHCFGKGKTSVSTHLSPPVESNPYAKDERAALYARVAQQVLEATKVNKGYCLIIGCQEGGLAYELAKRSELKIIGIDDDADKVKTAREMLDRAGLYGMRVSIQYGSLADLPYTKYLADLIVSEEALKSGQIPTPPDEIFRVMKPYGGVAYLGSPFMEDREIQNWIKNGSQTDWKIINNDGQWATMTRGGIEGSGEWTHLYANPSNTACSLDPVKAPLQIQWFGRPGPRKIINRHSRPMSTLFKNGRLFIPADNRVISIDAYNGTPLWEVEVPHSRILGALKDAGQMVVTKEYVYVAVSDQCWALDVATGEQKLTLKAPQLFPKEKRNWGYISVVGDQLFGSGKKPDASFYKLGRFNSFQMEGDFRDMILSDYVFSVNRFTGKTLWTYRNGAVFNNTITVGDGYLFLVDSRGPKAISDDDGRMRVDDFCDGKTFVVKLDMKTGEKIWEKYSKFPFDQIMYLSYANGVVLVTGSYNLGKDIHYALFGFDAKTGEKIWENSHRGGNTRWQTDTGRPTIKGEHGEQWQHPVIVGDRIILPPYDYDLHTGKKGNYELTRGGHGCGGLSGSSNYLFARGSNPKIYELHDGKESGKPLTRVNRPGCWINIIPAGGIVSIPESSSGCTCDYPIQTSFVFVPSNN